MEARELNDVLKQKSNEVFSLQREIEDLKYRQKALIGEFEAKKEELFRARDEKEQSEEDLETKANELRALKNE
jgi:chromosome segregation ATPase